MVSEYPSLPPRPCFVPPIPELDEAADLLSQAADALIARDNELARVLLRKADMRVLHAYADVTMNKMPKEVRRYKPWEGAPHALSRSKRAVLRMPSRADEDAIFRRDGYRCRYCGCRIVLKAGSLGDVGDRSGRG